MPGKLLLTYFVVLAFFPTAALATPEITFPTGARLATGSTLKAVNVGGIRTTSPSGTNTGECSAGSLTGTLVKNNGTEVEANIEAVTFTGTGAEGKCTIESPTGNWKFTFAIEQGLPWCLSANPPMKTDEFQIRGGKCSEASRLVRLALDLSVAGECKYKQEGLISGTFTTEPSDAVLTAAFPEFKYESGSFLCPSAFKFDVSFTLERDEAGTHPVYFSSPPPNTPELTYPTGTKLGTASKLRARNVGELKLTPTSGTFGCTTAEMTGSLTKNTGSEIEVDVEATNLGGTGSLADCTSSLGSFNLTTNVASGLPWCLRTPPTLNNDAFELRGGKCSEASRAIKVTMDITGSSECTYQRGSAIFGAFATHPAEATFTISGAEFTKTAGPETCPVAPKLDWTFTLEKDEEGTHPAYIS